MTAPLSQKSYLEAKILTASQPQLQLMLLEGAVRFSRQARQVMDGSAPEAERLLDQALDVVESLVHGVSGSNTEIASRLEEQYAFLFRELVTCRVHHDGERLDVVLNLLEYERETWKQACAGCGVPSDSATPVPEPEDRIFQGGMTAPLANPGLQDSGAGLSLEV